MTNEWIFIPNWDGKTGFQHYKDRDPAWIKNYTRLLSHDGYRDLTMSRRGILHGIWLAYASSSRRVRGDTLSLSRLLGQRVLSSDIEALNHAGFLQIVASTHARPRGRESYIDKRVEETPKGVSSSTTTRSYETDAPAPSPNGRAAVETHEDINIEPRTAPRFDCPHCDQIFPTWGDRQIHLDLDHVKETA